MTIDQKTRAIISDLSLPTPIAKYFTPDMWEIDLSTNTNPYLGSCAEYPDVLQIALKELYLSVLCSLDEHKSKWPPTEQVLSVDNILFTAGSLEGIDILIRALGEPKQDSVCVLQPTFSAYAHWAQIHSLKIVNIPLQGSNLTNIPVSEILSLNPAMIFICNPNNPTGTRVDTSIIQSLCEVFKGFVIIDEAYIEFSSFPSLWPLLNHYSNLIILRTFSKAWGLAGVRGGVILAHPSLIHAFRHIQLPFGFSKLAQDRIRERLEHPGRAFLSWKHIAHSREKVREGLMSLQGVEKVFKSETNFLMIILKNFQETMAILKKHGIFVLNCSASLPKSIRVSVGTNDQNLKFLKAMEEAST